MNILILVGTLSFGGAEKQAVNDANALSKKGNNVTIAFGKDGPLNSQVISDIRVINLRTLNKLIAIFRLLLFLIKNRFDIIHAHMFWAERIATIPALLTRHKVVFNEHGLGLWRKWYHVFTMKIISIFARKIICSCKKNESIRIERENLNRSKLITIYNSYIPTKKSKNIETKVHNDCFNIGFIGRFHQVKRLELFIDICRKLILEIEDFKIILVGDGPEKPFIEKAIDKEDFNDYFILPGFAHDTNNYYKNFDLFLLPSRIEASSLALIEAGYHGIASIAFDVGGNNEIIDNNDTGFLIKDKDIEEVVQKILLLYKNNEIRDRMGQNATNYIKVKFSQHTRIKKLMELYKNV